MDDNSRSRIRSLYPDIEPFHTGWLRVDDVHTLYYEQCGDVKGAPVIVLHGGPGSGMSPKCRRFFDPEAYCIIQMDQRGAGKSTPAAETKNNTTWDLVDDIEKLREQLGISSWVVFGGSWGGALSLIYSIKHSSRVRAIIIQGPVICNRSERDWMYGANGAAMVHPEAWAEVTRDIPKEEMTETIIPYYHHLLSGSDPDVRNRACRLWNRWELSIISMEHDLQLIEKCDREPLWNLQHAVIECHYLHNNYFLPEHDWVLHNLDRIENTPMTVIHGRYDMAVPLSNSYTLKQLLPRAELIVVPLAGHTTDNKGMESAIIQTTETYK